MVDDPNGSDTACLPVRYLLVGLLIPPLAWLLQMLIVETLAAQTCYPSTEPLPAPTVPWMRTALVLVSAACLVVGVFGSAIAWRNVRKIGSERRDALPGSKLKRTGLAWFLSRVAMMSSGLFLFALVATDVALAIVSPCRGW